MSKAELEAVRKAELEAKEKERETPEWASGLKQQREAAERAAAMAADASKPFARFKCGMWSHDLTTLRSFRSSRGHIAVGSTPSSYFAWSAFMPGQRPCWLVFFSYRMMNLSSCLLQFATGADCATLLCSCRQILHTISELYAQ